MCPKEFASHNRMIHRIGNDMVRKRLPSLSGHVLDVGCGEHPFEAEVLGYANSYIGMDWSNSLHDLKADVVADANRPFPFHGGTFDCGLSFEVMEHLREPKVMLREAFCILVCGRHIMVSALFQWWVREAPWLDNVWPEEHETTGYFITARKP